MCGQHHFSLQQVGPSLLALQLQHFFACWYVYPDILMKTARCTNSTCVASIYTTGDNFFAIKLNQSMNNRLLYLLWPTKDRSSASSKFLAVFCNLRGQIPKVSKEQSTCMCKRHILSNRSIRVACVRCLVKCMLENNREFAE